MPIGDTVVAPQLLIENVLLYRSAANSKIAHIAFKLLPSERSNKRKTVMSGKRAYVTYFDQRYVARAHAMLRSLRFHDPDAAVFALCFDEPARALTAELQDRQISFVSPRELYEFDPDLAACEGRGDAAFRATHKASLARYVLHRHPEFSGVAHIDADTYFFSSPQPLYDEIGEAPVAISPHRFFYNRRRSEWYGHFNAGYIYWKNDATGRRCLADYRDDCIRWCEREAMPDGRFMNQGYLTSWPQRYAGVHVIAHPGVNLAPWNIAGHSLSKQSEIRVDDRPLIFFHFSGIVPDSFGTWRSGYTEFGDNLNIARRAIYQPYLKAVERADRQAKHIWPGLQEAQPVWQWSETTVLLRRHEARKQRAAAIFRLHRMKLKRGLAMEGIWQW
jgi:hypothetical protein